MLIRYAKNMKLLTAILPLLVILFFSGVLCAHQDTELKYSKGQITGLPEKYLPASFNSNNLTLKISKQSLKLPKVLQRLLTVTTYEEDSDDPFSGDGRTEFRPFSMKFTASWYHQPREGGLPPYMLMSFNAKDASFVIEILVDMDKLKIIRANVILKNLGSVPIDLKDYW